MKTIDCAQGSTEWYRARLGRVTASEIDSLITPLWKKRTGEGVETYLCKKVSEKVLGWSPDELSGGSWAMGQGEIIEKIALPWFAFTYDVEPRRVGFCQDETLPIGCSPDALLGDDDGLEIKSPQPPTHLKYLLRGEVPPEYLPQIHFSMLVTGRPKWTFCSFSRQLPPLVVPVKRDEFIQGALRAALDSFLTLFNAALAKVEAMKAEIEAPAAAAFASAKQWGSDSR